MNGSKSALTVRGAYKTYDTKNYILRGLNMNVPEGTIYGLLGSSGCGKSTLLNSVVGLVGLDSGTIELSVKSINNIGYMPQAVALYEQLTVEELFIYFATMYGMSNRKRQIRMDLMYEVLDLPERHKSVLDLSGGQKRRVSLAVALIHDPELLILDEPTVGVDPILRHRIWQFLANWCEDGGKTVIITTHYIEETKQAHTIGLMREGIMLCEKSPHLIMEECSTQFLEDAFLKLSLQQNCEESTIIPIHSKQLTFSPIRFSKESFAMSRFTAELKKNVIFLWRNLMFTLFIFGLPCINLLLFYYTNGGEPEGLSLAVVNNDQPSCVNYSYQPNICDLSNLSCNYLHHLKQKKMSLVDYKEVTAAIDHAKDSHIWGVLLFLPDYSSALSARINEPLITDDAIVTSSSLIAYMDSSNNIIYDILSRNLRKSFLEMTGELHRACGHSVKLTNLPIKLEKPIYGKANPSFREFLAPALLTLLMFGMPLSYGFIIVEEKISGAASRTIIAGTTVFEVFTAHLSLHVVIQLFQTFISMLMLFWILNFPLEKPFLSSILLFLQGLAGIAVSFCLCTLLNSETALTSLSTAFVVENIMLGGMIWPIECIHPSIKLLSWITPISFTTQSLRTLSIKGWGLTNKEVYLGFISTCSWIIVFILITYVYVKRNKGKSFLSKNM